MKQCKLELVVKTEKDVIFENGMTERILQEPVCMQYSLSMKADYIKGLAFHMFGMFFTQGVLPNKEVGGLGPHIKFGGKIWGKVRPSSPNERKTWEVLSPQDAKVGKKSQFWGHI